MDRRPAETQPSTEDAFRSSLEDVAKVLETLGTLFPSTADLAAAVSLALTNDGQLRLLLEKVTAPGRR